MHDLNFREFDVGQIVDDNIQKLTNSNLDALNQEQLIKVFKVSIYQSIQKYHEELGKFLNRNSR